MTARSSVATVLPAEAAAGRGDRRTEQPHRMHLPDLARLLVHVYRCQSPQNCLFHHCKYPGRLGSAWCHPRHPCPTHHHDATSNKEASSPLNMPCRSVDAARNHLQSCLPHHTAAEATHDAWAANARSAPSCPRVPSLSTMAQQLQPELSIRHYKSTHALSTSSLAQIRSPSKHHALAPLPALLSPCPPLFPLAHHTSSLHAPVPRCASSSLLYLLYRVRLKLK